MWKTETTSIDHNTLLDTIGLTLFQSFTKEDAEEYWKNQIGWAAKWEGDDVREAAINRIMFDILTSFGEWWDAMCDNEGSLWRNLNYYCECELPICLDFLQDYKYEPNLEDKDQFYSKDYMNGWYHYSYDLRKEE